MLFLLLGCSAVKKVPEPTSPFLQHSEQLKSYPDRFPWDGVWIKEPEKMLTKQDRQQRIYIADINTQYIAHERRPAKPEDLLKIEQDIKDEFANAIKGNESLLLEDDRKNADLVLEIAITELSPTVIAENIVADVGSLVIPGSTLLEETAVVGGAAAGGALASGAIAIEMKIKDASSEEVLAEIKDRQTDPASILPNVKDFERYGWTKREIRDWARQFATAFSTEATYKIDSSAGVSLLPW